LSGRKTHISPRALGIYVAVVILAIGGGLSVGLRWSAIACLVVFISSIFLIATELTTRSTSALLGAFLTFIIFLVEGSHSPVEIAHHYIEMNTILTLFGIMVVALLGLKSGLFYFLGMKVAKASRGDPVVLYFMLAFFTLILNVFLIAVATIVVVVSLTIAICEILKIEPYSYIVMEIFIVNVAASASMISAVPNIIIAEEAGLSYGFFIINLFPFVMGFFLLSIWLLYRISPPPTTVDIIRASAIQELDEWLFVKNKREFYVSAMCISGLIIGFIVSRELMVVSILFAVVALAMYSKPEELIRSVDWDTLLFFIGFYIIIAGLSITGILNNIAHTLFVISRGNIFVLISLLFWISIIVSGFVDNIPYVLVIIPIIEILTSTGSLARYSALFWILLILACNIGGGLNPYSAPQNLLALSLSKEAKYPIPSEDFYRVSIKWTLIGGSVAYVYVLTYIAIPIIIARVGYTSFIILVIAIISALLTTGIQLTIGLRRFATLSRRTMYSLAKQIGRILRRLKLRMRRRIMR